MQQCEECAEQQSKYKCPKCGRRTCSLACAKKHKTVCDGVRDKTAFVPRSQLGMPTLMSDYCFLEDAHRIADNASRDNSNAAASQAAAAGAAGSASCGRGSHRGGRDHPSEQPHGRPKLTPAQAQLVRECHNRRVRLELMPEGMKRHDTNTTTFDKRSRAISWTIEWTFVIEGSIEAAVRDMSVIALQHGVAETSSIAEMLDSLLDDSTQNPDRLALWPLRNTGREQIGVFLVLEGARTGSRLERLDPAATLKEAISGHTVIEYPRLVAGVCAPEAPRDRPDADGATADAPCSGQGKAGPGS